MATGSLIRKEEALDNFIRGQIFGYITANPGAHYNRIREELDLNNGAIIYHLDALEKLGYISSYEDGCRKCYVSRGVPAVHVKTQREGILEDALRVVKRKPGISQKGIAQRLGMSARKLNYYIGHAEQSGSVKAERSGRFVRYFPL
jgi:predicted transcriptional regulator